jgi:hypothetical protein
VKNELNLYDSILNRVISSKDNKNTYPNISISKSYQDILPNITIQDSSLNYCPNIDLMQFMSATNDSGNLYTFDDNNPEEFNNSRIATIYNGFENIYSVIQYLLDLIIYRLNTDTVVFDLCEIIKQSNHTTLNDYVNYLKKLERKYKQYLLLVTDQTNKALTYSNSYIYNRIDRLLWDKSTHKLADFAWAKYIGYDLIDELSIKIGGQLIDKHDYK